MVRNILKLFLIITLLINLNSVNAKTDTVSKEYLQSKKHIAIMNPVVEAAVEKSIKKSLKKETGANFSVKFEGYTLSSMKKGVFKYLEITGKDIELEKIPVPYVNLKTITDYNYIDYQKNPIEFKSDMEFQFAAILSENTMNIALTQKDYKELINKVNGLAYPLMRISKVRTKIKEEKIYIYLDYNFPLFPAKREKTFITSTSLEVVDGKIKLCKLHFDSAYGSIPLDKVYKLISFLNPLEFTLDLLDSKQCQGRVENVNIVDNKVKIDGKIFVKGDE